MSFLSRITLQQLGIVAAAAALALIASSCMENGAGCAGSHCRSRRASASTSTPTTAPTTTTTQPWATTTTTTTTTTMPPSSSLPAPTHPIDFGYYYANGRYGNYSSEVFPFTNATICFSTAYDSAATWGNPDPSLDIANLFRATLQEAYNAGKTIFLLAPAEADWDRMLDVAAPFWSRVRYLEMFAERPDVSAATAEATVNRMIQKLDSRHLSHPLFGAMESPQAETAPNIDYVGIEAYIDSSLQNSPGVVQALNDRIDQRKASVGGGRKIVLIMQAFDRNFLWTNIESLKQVQYPAYLKAYNDPRVSAIMMFSYARPGGARQHPELRDIHRQMGERILSVVTGF